MNYILLSFYVQLFCLSMWHFAAWKWRNIFMSAIDYELGEMDNLKYLLLIWHLLICHYFWQPCCNVSGIFTYFERLTHVHLCYVSVALIYYCLYYLWSQFILVVGIPQGTSSFVCVNVHVCKKKICAMLWSKCEHINFNITEFEFWGYNSWKGSIFSRIVMIAAAYVMIVWFVA